MKHIKSNPLFYFLLALILQLKLSGQPVVIDKIVAVVGDKAILFSDVEAQALQMQAQSGVSDSTIRCNVLEDIIIQKLLLNQAEKDSVTVSDEQVDGELNKKIRYFVNQIGSVEKLEAYLGKSIIKIKDDFKERIRDQLVVQQMQSKIAGDLKVTPAEVKTYFDNIPQDSLPLIESEIQVAQILKKPPVNEVERQRVKGELLDIKEKLQMENHSHRWQLFIQKTQALQ